MSRKSSKRRSGTNSPSAPRSQPVVYIDESLSQKYLPEALRALGLIVYTVRDLRPSGGLKDEEWLREVGGRGWLALTKDKAIRRRPNEILAFKNANVRAVVLSAGTMTGPDQAALFTRRWPKLLKYANTLTPPFLVRLEKTGGCEVLFAGRTRKHRR